MTSLGPKEKNKFAIISRNQVALEYPLIDSANGCDRFSCVQIVWGVHSSPGSKLHPDLHIEVHFLCPLAKI